MVAKPQKKKKKKKKKHDLVGDRYDEKINVSSQTAALLKSRPIFTSDY